MEKYYARKGVKFFLYFNGKLFYYITYYITDEINIEVKKPNKRLESDARYARAAQPER